MMQKNSHLAWPVNYEPGKLLALGFRAGRRVAEIINETSGIPSRIVLESDRKRIAADGEDVATIRISVVDAEGRFVPTADQTIHIEISGEAKLLGMGNGDPSSHEPEKTPSRRMFNGLALALIQSTDRAGEIRIQAHSPGLTGSSVLLKSSVSTIRPRV
jgi:beta-galactosidase